MKIKPIFAPLALLVFAGCGSNASTTPETATNSAISAQTAATPPASSMASATAMPAMTPINAPGAKVDSKKFRVRGLVNGVEKSIGDGRMTLIVNHEDIAGFMPAMQMRLPFARNEDAAKVKKGEKIAFDVQRSNLEASNFEKLPPATPLKLNK